MIVNRVNAGDPLKMGAGAYNAFADAANDYVRRQPPPFSAPRPRPRGQPQSAGAVRWARITAHSGAAPYRYSATEVEHAGAATFTDLANGVSTDTFVNTAELASSDCPARYVPNGTVVRFDAGGGGWFLFTFNGAGGTYS